MLLNNSELLMFKITPPLENLSVKNQIISKPYLLSIYRALISFRYRYNHLKILNYLNKYKYILQYFINFCFDSRRNVTISIIFSSAKVA